MAGTVVQTHSRRDRIGVVTFTIVGDSVNGTVPATNVETEITGRLIAIETDPGMPAPTANYDVTLLDQNGFDVLESVGVNRSATVTEKATILASGASISPPVHRTDTLTLTIANQSVASAQITIKLYYEGVHG